MSRNSVVPFGIGAVVGYLVIPWVMRTVASAIVKAADQSNKRSSSQDLQGKSIVPAPRRFGAAIRLRPESYRRYRELHDNVWDSVLKRMYNSNMRNFVIYYHPETSTLFQHYEWIGHIRYYKENQDAPLLTRDEEIILYEADMNEILLDPNTREWWKLCEPCQIPFLPLEEATQCKPSQADISGDKSIHPWWSSLECVSHCGYWPVIYEETQSRDPDFVPLRT
jgi:L-rhamnose mutarotase